MNTSQWHIGAPNGVVVCIDRMRMSGRYFSGRMYHRYSRECIPFLSAEQVVFHMEALFNQLRFPLASTAERTFSREVHAYPLEVQECVMKDEELLSKHGDLGTFIIRVRQRQNSSWQGAITWMEENKTVNFRSIWEMVKLIEGAMDASGAAQEKPEATWPESSNS